MHNLIEAASDIRFQVAFDPDAEDGINQALRDGTYPGDFRQLLALVRATVRPGGRVLDLGAHLGSFTLAIAAAGYEVAAVEASPRNVDLLRESVRLNGFSRVHIVHAAISDHVGRMEFCPAGPYGHVAISGDHAPSTSVGATTVEQLLDDLGWDRVDFIKIDVEGSEIAALGGMGRHSRGEDAPILFVESNGHTLHFFSGTPFDLKQSLTDLGYRVFAPKADQLVLVCPEDFQPETVVDLVALKTIPSSLRERIIETGQPHDEVVAATLASCRAANAAERAYIARALCDAPRSLLRSPAIRDAARTLAEDAVPAVRVAASQIPTRGRWPWSHRQVVASPGRPG